MVRNTAPAAEFSDDFDAEPTVADRATLHPGRIPGWNDRSGTWRALTETGIRAAFRADAQTTHRDLPAVAA